MKFLCETFKNGVVVANTTLHNIILQDADGVLKQVPQCGTLVNAKTVETQVRRRKVLGKEKYGNHNLRFAYKPQPTSGIR